MRFLLLLSLITCAFFAAQNPALAQGFPGSRGGGGGFGNIGQGRGGGGTGLVVRDTSPIFYFYAENPADVFPFRDSLLGNFQQYDPIRQRQYDLGNLGNLGSAHRQLFFQPTWRRGFDVGLHQFDAYQMRTEDVRFYKIEQATTQAGFSQGPNQNNTQTFVRFSRNFADGLNLSLEHRRIKNQGAYDFQQAINSDVAVGMWYHNKFGNYDGFFSFVTNSVQQQDNGGILDGQDGQVIDAFQVDVNLQSSNTRYANKEYAYTQYFYLNKIFSEASVERRQKRKEQRAKMQEQRRQEREQLKALRDSVALDSTLALPDSLGMVDSLKTTPPVDTISPEGKPPGKPKGEGKPPGQPDGRPQGPPPSGASTGSQYPGAYPGASPQSQVPEGRTFTLYHQLAWRTESYKFSAEPSDSLFFGDFWVDDRGLRHFVETRKLQNTFKLQTFKLRQSTSPDSLGRSLPRQSDLLEVGLVHAANFVDQEPRDTGTLHNLFLTGKFNFSPSDRLRVNTYAHLGLGANAGDFRLSGELFLNLKKVGNLRLEAVNQLYSPTLVQHQFFVSENQIWKNDFAKTLETSLLGTYSLPLANASVTGQAHLVNELIYFDTAGLPQQQGGVTNIFQLIFRKDFHFGPLHSENWVGLQETTSDVLRLPQVYTKHSLYLEGKIFKKVMLTRIGADARLATAYTPTGYQPLTGQFYLQNEQLLPFTPLVDAFLSFKVKTFRFFFKIENVLSFPLDEYYFQTARHPQPFGFGNGGLRMGINWRLVD